VRTLFLLLLLANLLFAAWARWVAPAPSAPGHATPTATGPASIQLLRELPASGAQPSAGAELSAVDDPSLACVSAGPFLARADAERAAARLERLGFTVRLRDAPEDVRVGYWVRLEGLATPEDAENARAALQGAGLTDAIVITEEGIGPMVSLGVHTDLARAEATAAFARVAGFEPRTVDRLRSENVTWLDVDRRSSGGLPALDELEVAAGEQPTSLEFRACPSTGTGAEAP
jgi:hypothetical protein